MNDRKLVILIAGAILTASVSACSNPTSVEQPTAAEQALVVLDIPHTSAQSAGYEGASSGLVLDLLDPESLRPSESRSDEVYLLNWGPHGQVPTRVAKTIKPGLYAVTRYMLQIYWGVCFSGETLAVQVKPGDVLYLGEIDAAFHNRQLTATMIAARKDKFTMNGVNPRAYIAFVPDATPQLRLAASAAELADVESYVNSAHPGFTNPVQNAPFYPVHMNTKGFLDSPEAGNCGSATPQYW